MIRPIYTLVFVLGCSFLTAQLTDIERKLYELPDVIFHESEPLANGVSYELRIKQPLDHTDPSKGYFYQKAYLHHRDMDQPTVIVTEGYTCRRHKLYEVTEILQANQLHIEHRYFGESMPDSLDYDYLNLEQATADYHHIRTLFDEIYAGKWLSTGISKGGATTIFYKYLYPADVDVAVPYVAPINDEYEEDRIYTFLDTVGTAECRKKLLDVQRRVLKNRDQVMPLIKYFAKGAGAKYTYLQFEEAFEYAVLEYPFSFWQWGASCEDIPDNSTDLDELLDHFLAVSDVTFFADGAMEAYASHYYQSAEEFGYYGYETDELAGLIKMFPPNSRPHAAFTPGKMTVDFDDRLLKGLHKWLKKDAHQMIYLYGANDTWTASAVPKNDKVDAVWFFMEGKSHGDARIKNMTAAELELLNASLERWLGVEVD